MRLSPLAVAALVVLSACPHPGAAPAAPEAPAAPAEVRLTLPGTIAGDWNRINGAMSDTLYHFGYSTAGHAIVGYTNLTEGRRLRLSIAPASVDSMSIAIDGTEYVGHGDSPGVIRNDRTLWRPIASGSPAARTLDDAARRLKLAFAPADAPVPSASAGPTAAPSSPRQSFAMISEPVPELKDLGGGRFGFCKANTVERHHLIVVDNVALDGWCPLPDWQVARLGTHNVYVLVDPAATPVGGTLEVCSYAGVPRGFALVEWFTDPRRCPFDPQWKYRHEPNMMRLVRVEQGAAEPR